MSELVILKYYKYTPNTDVFRKYFQNAGILHFNCSIGEYFELPSGKYSLISTRIEGIYHTRDDEIVPGNSRLCKQMLSFENSGKNFRWNNWNSNERWTKSHTKLELVKINDDMSFHQVENVFENDESILFGADVRISKIFENNENVFYIVNQVFRTIGTRAYTHLIRINKYSFQAKTLRIDNNLFMNFVGEVDHNVIIYDIKYEIKQNTSIITIECCFLIWFSDQKMDYSIQQITFDFENFDRIIAIVDVNENEFNLFPELNLNFLIEGRGTCSVADKKQRPGFSFGSNFITTSDYKYKIAVCHSKIHTPSAKCQYRPDSILYQTQMSLHNYLVSKYNNQYRYHLGSNSQKNYLEIALQIYYKTFLNFVTEKIRIKIKEISNDKITKQLLTLLYDVCFNITVYYINSLNEKIYLFGDDFFIVMFQKFHEVVQDNESKMNILKKICDDIIEICESVDYRDEITKIFEEYEIHESYVKGLQIDKDLFIFSDSYKQYVIDTFHDDDDDDDDRIDENSIYQMTEQINKIKKLPINSFNCNIGYQYYSFFMIYDNEMNEFRISDSFLLQNESEEYIFSLLYSTGLIEIDNDHMLMTSGEGDYRTTITVFQTQSVIDSCKHIISSNENSTGMIDTDLIEFYLFTQAKYNQEFSIHNVLTLREFTTTNVNTENQPNKKQKIGGKKYTRKRHSRKCKKSLQKKVVKSKLRCRSKIRF